MNVMQIFVLVFDAPCGSDVDGIKAAQHRQAEIKGRVSCEVWASALATSVCLTVTGKHEFAKQTFMYTYLSTGGSSMHLALGSAMLDVPGSHIEHRPTRSLKSVRRRGNVTKITVYIFTLTKKNQWYTTDYH